MCLTGLCCLTENDSLLLFRQNSLGDVFLQELQDRRDDFQNRLSDHDFELLKDWGNQCAKAVEVPDNLCKVRVLSQNNFFTGNIYKLNIVGYVRYLFYRNALVSLF